MNAEVRHFSLQFIANVLIKFWGMALSHVGREYDERKLKK